MKSSRRYVKGRQDVLEFRDMIDVSQVEGIYIEDLYVPIE